MKPDYRQTVLALATTRPHMKASTLVALVEALAGPEVKPSDPNDSAALASWAMAQPEVAAYVGSNKKIHAIKEIRALTGASLAQAKNAIDAIPASKWGAS